jgi:hypothetical protein
LEEIYWILKNSFDSNEFQKKKYKLGWLILSKSKKKLNENNCSAKIFRVDYKNCEKDSFFYETIANVIEFLMNKLNKSSQPKTDNDNFKIKRKNADRIDPKDKKFKNQVKNHLKEFFENLKSSESSSPKIKKKGNLMFAEILSEQHLMQHVKDNGKNC